MAQENWQKIKILKLLELLQQQTDDQHPLTTTQICAKMDLIGIPCDREGILYCGSQLLCAGTEDPD